MKKGLVCRFIVVSVFCSVFVCSSLLKASLSSGAPTVVGILGPTTITSPGSYRLFNDIVGTVTIDADNVDLDLNNKTITADGFDTIDMTGHYAITIKNGVIKGPSLSTSGIDGIFIDTCSVIEISDIDFFGKGTSDIGLNILTSTGVVVERCNILGYVKDGIKLNNCNTCQICDNKIFDNTINGIFVTDSSLYNTISENMCNDNGASGISLENTSTLLSLTNNKISRNTCMGNTADGIRLNIVSNNNILEENICLGNGAKGIRLGVSSALNTACTFNTLVGNICTGNSEDGILLYALNSGGSSGHPCNDNTVTKNICHDNGSDGIDLSATASNQVTFNECNQNGAFGITAVNSTNRVYNNSAIDNGTDNYATTVPVIQIPNVTPVTGSNFDV